MPTSSQELPAEPDLWAPVGFEHLPRDLVSAFRGGDWPQVRVRLQTVMDAMITDGPYGRELFQLVTIPGLAAIAGTGVEMLVRLGQLGKTSADIGGAAHARLVKKERCRLLDNSRLHLD